MAEWISSVDLEKFANPKLRLIKGGVPRCFVTIDQVVCSRVLVIYSCIGHVGPFWVTETYMKHLKWQMTLLLFTTSPSTENESGLNKRKIIDAQHLD